MQVSEAPATSTRSSVTHAHLIAFLGRAALPLQDNPQRRALGELVEEDARNGAHAAQLHSAEQQARDHHTTTTTQHHARRALQRESLEHALQSKQQRRAEIQRAKFDDSLRDARSAKSPQPDAPKPSNDALRSTREPQPDSRPADHKPAQPAGNHRPSTNAAPRADDAGTTQRPPDQQAAPRQTPTNPAQWFKLNQSAAAQRSATRGVEALQGAARAATVAPARGPASSSTPSAAPTTQPATTRAARATATPRAAQPAEQQAQKGEPSEQVVRVIRQQIRAGRVKSIMRLDPPELGSIRLNLDVTKDNISVRVVPATETAHRVLTNDLEILRRGLEALGLRVDRLEVRPAEPLNATPAAQQNDAGDPAAQHDTAGSGGADTTEHSAKRDSEEHADADSAPPTDHTEHGAADATEPDAERLVNLIA